MAEASSFHSETRRLLRDRALETARDIVCTEGWGAVSMSRVAREVGISRPVLYKELGSRESLAEALIEREVDQFMAGIIDGLAPHTADPVAGLTAATEFALHTAAENSLIKAILTGRQAGDTALLPAVMTEPEPVLVRVLDTLTDAVRAQYGLPAVEDATLKSMVEVVIRMNLSHIFQPLGTVERAIEQVAAVIAGIFARPPVSAIPVDLHRSVQTA
ncbi:TetR/AcrR family transcriptional regulator [Nocardia nova]|uniref:TetR/AcrR family transcriptional regulator n=1 Tax=Nocardia nova TaxID=37330 RepID=A0A2S6AKG7_9NOCA|nr:TetR family transcriptional regulator [Nocardia nova]PPJ24955.1 TetR/AcrR family transcriptional regulator [Nocardia nova]PPJ35717.1 TetR/AcrR family transcriptional regulator [Nocardia nova]